MTRGHCRFCRCSHFEPCPAGCGWVDRRQTLCTECREIALAWEALTVARMPNMVRAFFHGYVAGADDERSTGDKNPYDPIGRSHRYWELGFTCGAGRRVATS